MLLLQIVCCSIYICFCTYVYVEIVVCRRYSLRHSFNQSVNQVSQYSQCASMCHRARPCTRIRVHALQCVPMRLLVQPTTDARLRSVIQCDITAFRRTACRLTITIIPLTELSSASSNERLRDSLITDTAISKNKITQTIT